MRELNIDTYQLIVRTYGDILCEMVLSALQPHLGLGEIGLFAKELRHPQVQVGDRGVFIIYEPDPYQDREQVFTIKVDFSEPNRLVVVHRNTMIDWNYRPVFKVFAKEYDFDVETDNIAVVLSKPVGKALDYLIKTHPEDAVIGLL